MDKRNTFGDTGEEEEDDEEMEAEPKKYMDTILLMFSVGFTQAHGSSRDSVDAGDGNCREVNSAAVYFSGACLRISLSSHIKENKLEIGGSAWLLDHARRRCDRMGTWWLVLGGGVGDGVMEPAYFLRT
ncbi:unnamed protein product [Mesocestoides corti]|uniref:Uncharacterized protein n=1 Tax=Mesocestoides corti TaxID=53468 RepID=A0A0R3URK3_MESCO|nr:unnamed protein product [Mesocestoides corti]